MTHADAIAVQQSQYARDIAALERAYEAGQAGAIGLWEDIVNSSRELLLAARTDAELAAYLASEDTHP